MSWPDVYSIITDVQRMLHGGTVNREEEILNRIFFFYPTVLTSKPVVFVVKTGSLHKYTSEIFDCGLGYRTIINPITGPSYFLGQDLRR